MTQPLPAIHSRQNDSRESELVTRLVNGDNKAFGRLYDIYLGPIFRYIFYRVGDQNDAEDLTEIVFLKVLESLPSRRKRRKIRNFRAWLYKIAHNVVVDFYRASSPKILDDDVSQLRDDGSIPEIILQQGEERIHLSEAISELQPNLQQVILCRFISQLTHAETAQIMGITEGHVRVLQHRALKLLKIKLK